MGANTSLPFPPVKPGFSMMCLSFQYSDTITALHFDDGSLSAIRQAINDTWKAGIKSEKIKCGSGWSFKLNGYPFRSTSSNVSQQSQQMVCQIVQKLNGIGWKVIASTNLGRYVDRSTMFFQKSSPVFSTLPYLCVGLSSSDKLQIVNLPPQLFEPMKQIIQLHWSLGIQKEETLGPGVLEIKLRGKPWWSTNEQSIMAKILLQNIISNLRHYQWVYTCNVNLQSAGDSLIFQHDQNINPCESTKFCTISLNQYDRIRVINAPDDIVAMVRKVIQTTWVHGCIQNERDFHGSWEFKLSGNPWHSIKEESAMAHYLVGKILEAMLEQGWHNIAGVDISRRLSDKSVLIFQKGEPKRCPIMCLSLNDVNTFRLINMPNELMVLFKQALGSRWLNGIQREQLLTLSVGTAYEIMLSGLPWSGGDNNDTMHAHSFLCSIIQEFKERGWTLLLCADVSAKYTHRDNGPDNRIDVHSMWFVYDPVSSTQPAAPNYGFNFASCPTQYSMGMQTSTAPAMPGIGLQPDQINEPPPTYTQATAWHADAAKQ